MSLPEDPRAAFQADLPEARAALFDIVFRRTADGIAIASVPNERGERTIEQINPSGCAIIGMDRSHWFGKTPAQVFPKNPSLIALFMRPDEITLDVRLPQKRLAVGTGIPLGDGRRLVILHDVTERRELDSRREAMNSTITHDLRNPIMGIGGYLDLAMHSEDEREQRDFMQRAQNATQKLYEVLGPLTDLAWLEAGMPLKHQPIRLGDVITRTLTELQSLAVQKGVTFAASIQQPMPLVMGDSEQLQTAFSNLIHNAINYSYSDTIIAIHAWGDHREAYLTVADRGIGIAQEEINVIFDRLYRSKDERVRAIPGAGLGLTVARRIAQRHGGTLWVSSTLNKGSTFTLSLPAVEA